jgi:hypothetical protein
LHFHAQNRKIPFMYIFAEPVTEEEADEIQNSKQAEQKAFARDIVGIDQNDPEVQKEWHDIQERVNDEIRGQVDEDEDVDILNRGQAAEDEAVENGEEGEVSEGIEESEDTIGTEEEVASVDTKNNTEGANVAENLTQNPESTISTTNEGPLMGWTLTIRNRVNGFYVDRPENLSSEDVWTVEYHVKEIAPDDRWALYNKVKDNRHKLLGITDDVKNKSLLAYRAIIHNYSRKGRAWREQQDEAESGREKQIFRPMGPGSEIIAGNKS